MAHRRTGVASDHWACSIEHPPERGYRPGEGHRLGCHVAHGHDADRKPFRCRVCARKYRPPLTDRRIQSTEAHYSCAIARDEHEPPVPFYSKTGHRIDCPTRGLHLAVALKDCIACDLLRRGKLDTELPTGRTTIHAHWACALPAGEHVSLPGIGYGHRIGCEMAEGHVSGPIHNCPACRKDYWRTHGRGMRLQKDFRITESEYDALLAKQGGLCAICHEPPPDHRKLAVDHSHVTGSNRGLLCYRCNVGLGNFRDREDVLVSAIAYLRGQPVA